MEPTGRKGLTLDKAMLLCACMSVSICVLVLVLGRHLTRVLVEPAMLQVVLALAIWGRDPWSLHPKERVVAIYLPGVLFIVCLIPLVQTLVMLGAELPARASLFTAYLVATLTMCGIQLVLVRHLLMSSTSSQDKPSSEQTPEART